MKKPLNKKIQFVKTLKESSISDAFVYRVKSFGENESVIIVDKKATTVSNDMLFQDMECYKSNEKLVMRK